MENSKGFTLIELLAVVVVLGIILGIAFPVTMNVVESSREKAFDASNEVLVNAAREYIVTENIDLPSGTGDSIDINYLDLKNSDKLSILVDPKDKTECTNSKVVVTNTGDNEYEYTAVVICSNYTTVVNQTSCSLMDKVWYNDECNTKRSSGDMVTDDSGYYVVESVDDLNAINTDETSLAANYVLGKDLDLSGISNFDPIGDDTTAFSGAFDGQGYTISNLTIDRSSESYVGLFGLVNAATIDNLNLENVDVSAVKFVGGFVGQAFNGSVIDNCSIVSGTIYSTDAYVGVFVGENYGSTIKNSYANISVFSLSYAVGGFAGCNSYSGVITDCYAIGNVESESHIVGGFVGANKESALTKNCYATGDVSALKRVGGFAGHITSSSTIRNCYAIGDIINNADPTTEDTWEFGGFAGYMENSTLKYVYSTGDIIGEYAEAMGGLVGGGNAVAIESAYSLTSTTNSSNSYVAGFVGKSYATSTLRNIYMLGDIAGSFRVGEIVAGDLWVKYNTYEYINQTYPTLYYSSPTPVASVANLNDESWFTDTLLFDSNWLISSSNTMLDTKGESIIKPLLYRVDDSNNPTTTLVAGQQ